MSAVYFVPHAGEKINGSTGVALSGTSYHFTNASATVTATGSLFTTELAVGMSIASSNQAGVNYIVSTIASDTSLTLTVNFSGSTTTTATATRTSYTFSVSGGRLIIDSDGTDWTLSTTVPGASIGLSSARPAPTGSGKTYYCTDIPVMYVDDPASAAWKQFIVMSAPTAPVLGSYTLVGNLALNQYADCIRATLFSDANSVGNAALIAASLAAASTWTVELAASFNTWGAEQYPCIGVCVANGVTSGTSNSWGIEVVGSTSTILIHQAQNVVGSGARIGTNHEVTAHPGQVGGGNAIRLRLLADGTNLHYQHSTDGLNWCDLYIAATPTVSYYGFSLGNDFTSGDAVIQALVYKNQVGSLTVAQATITGATNANPIVVTTSAAHNFQSGDMVAIHGVGGNTNANSGTGTAYNSGAALIKVLSSTTFQLVGVSGNASYTSGGTATLVSR